MGLDRSQMYTFQKTIAAIVARTYRVELDPPGVRLRRGKVPQVAQKDQQHN